MYWCLFTPFQAVLLLTMDSKQFDFDNFERQDAISEGNSTPAMYSKFSEGSNDFKRGDMMMRGGGSSSDHLSSLHFSKGIAPMHYSL